MHARAALLEPTNQLKKMVEGEVRMQATDNVEFGGAFPDALLRALISFFEREGVRARGVRVAPKGAKFAVRYANVRRINVPVDVVIGDVAMPLFADVVRQPAYRQQIGRAVQCNAVLSFQARSR